MTTDRFARPTTRLPPPAPTDLIADYRARLASQKAETDERRRTALAEQVSALNTPDQRIRIWERLHELGLPRSPDHPLIRVIAADTELTLIEVRAEQARRLAAANLARIAAPPAG
jgi:hypothetical protein